MNSAPKDDQQLSGFDFDNGGRRYQCSVEALRAGSAERWWCFRVAANADSPHGSQPSSRERQWLPDAPAPRSVMRTEREDGHRYAPFRVESDDTRGSVQSRVVSYYDDLVARREQPASHIWRSGSRKPAAGAK